jgi:hypothetical protein
MASASSQEKTLPAHPAALELPERTLAEARAS